MLANPARAAILKALALAIGLIVVGAIGAQILWGQPQAHFRRDQLRAFPPGWRCNGAPRERWRVCFRTAPLRAP